MAPEMVKTDGISLNISQPAIIAKTRLKYLIGVTKEISASRIDFVKKIFPIEPLNPMMIK